MQAPGSIVKINSHLFDSSENYDLLLILMRKRFSVFLVDMISQTFPVPKMRHDH